MHPAPTSPAALRATTPTERVREAYRREAAVGRPEVWLALRPEADALADAADVEARLAAGADLPLAGLMLAVKDNVDVAGLPTTAGHPDYAHTPERSATAVRRLVDAGAVVMGKTALDQFATGLSGARSLRGAVRSAVDPERVAGGSSSGSGAAVGLGIVDLAIATDTAGSGRVPAAFNGIVGIKATYGLVPKDGVIPACPSYDCVTVLAPTLALAAQAIRLMSGPSPLDPASRDWPADVRLGAPPAPRVAIPRDEDLATLGPQARELFAAAAARLEARGAVLGEIDLTPFLRAARLLYEGGLVAERHASFGEFLAEHPEQAEPSVAAITSAAAHVTGSAVVRDQELLRTLRAEAMGALAGFDALLTPTAPSHPTVAAVQAEPIAVNARLGVYTNFVNLLDLAAVAVPAGASASEGLFGVSVVTRAFEDQVALDLAGWLTGEEPPLYPATGVPTVVFGAHLSGEARNHELHLLGARFVREVVTAPDYRMHVTADGNRPIVVPTVPGAGSSFPGEEWLLSVAALGRLVTRVAAPLSIGHVTLDDGSSVVGFAGAVTGLEADISAAGGWRSHRRAATATAKAAAPVP